MYGVRLSKKFLESLVKDLNLLESKDVREVELTRTTKNRSLKDFYFNQAEYFHIHNILSNYKVKDIQHSSPGEKRSKYKIIVSKREEK